MDSSVRYGTVQVPYGTLPYGTVLYRTVPYRTVYRYRTVPYLLLPLLTPRIPRVFKQTCEFLVPGAWSISFHKVAHIRTTITSGTRKDAALHDEGSRGTVVQDEPRRVQSRSFPICCPEPVVVANGSGSPQRRAALFVRAGKSCCCHFVVSMELKRVIVRHRPLKDRRLPRRTVVGNRRALRGSKTYY